MSVKKAIEDQRLNEKGDDPIQNRRLSHACWNGHDNHRNCNGWIDGAPPTRCQCLCHSRETKARVHKAAKLEKTIMEVYGTIDVGKV